MSGPDWLTSLTEQAQAARSESADEIATRRLALTFREADPDEIEINRRLGDWYFDWSHRGNMRQFEPIDDSSLPSLLVDQWQSAQLVGFDFSPNALLFWFRGRFVVATLGTETDPSDSLPTVMDLLHRHPDYQEPTHVKELDALLESLPDTPKKALALGQREHYKRMEGFEALRSQWEFSGVVPEAYEIAEGHITFTFDEEDEDWSIEFQQPNDDSAASVHVGYFNPETLADYLLLSRIEPKGFGAVGDSWDKQVLLYRGRWIVAFSAQLEIPDRLRDPGTDSWEALLFSHEVSKHYALTIANDDRFDVPRERPELDELLARLPQDPETVARVESVTGPIGAVALRRRQGVPERIRNEVWRRDDGRCVECGSNERLEFDHIIPWSRGGSDTARNLQLLCEACNRRKSARI